MTAMALNIRRWRLAVATHDIENPTHTSYGIGVSPYDAKRLGLEDGEELWYGVRLSVINCTAGNFRVLCDGEHDDCKPKTLEEKEARETELPKPLEPVFA
jgi:hypothetical protein